MRQIFLLSIIASTFSLYGCSDFLSATPNKAGSSDIYHMDQLYNLMGNYTLYRSGYPWSDFMYLADGYEMTPYYVISTNNTGIAYSVYCWDKDFIADYNLVTTTWTPVWNPIYHFNTALEEMDRVIQTKPAIRKEVEGEALFGRAYHHFITLVQYALWDEDAPGIGYRTNTNPGDIPKRETVKYTLDMIYQDLDNAEAALREAGRTQFELERNFRPTVPTVKALRARIDLYRGNYTSALENANAALAGYDYLLDFKNDDLYEVYEQDYINVLDQNNATIVGTIPYRTLRDLLNRGAQALAEYPEFYLPHMSDLYYGNRQNTPISESYFNLFDRENDERWKRFYDNNLTLRQVIAKSVTLPGNTSVTPLCFTWEDQQNYTESNRHAYLRFASTSAGKYYILWMTTAEMYLIKAECLARAGNTAEAANVLRTLRRTRFTTTEAADNIGGTLQEVLDERAREMSELWRFFDIKRLNGADNANIKVTRTVLSDYANINSAYTLEIGPNDPRWAVPISTQQIILMGWEQN